MWKKNDVTIFMLELNLNLEMKSLLYNIFREDKFRGLLNYIFSDKQAAVFKILNIHVNLLLKNIFFKLTRNTIIDILLLKFFNIHFIFKLNLNSKIKILSIIFFLIYYWLERQRKRLNIEYNNIKILCQA